MYAYDPLQGPACRNKKDMSIIMSVYGVIDYFNFFIELIERTQKYKEPREWHAWTGKPSGFVLELMCVAIFKWKFRHSYPLLNSVKMTNVMSNNHADTDAIRIEFSSDRQCKYHARRRYKINIKNK